jgi:hypothetical protein
VDKATEIKVDTSVETVKCKALLRNIIRDGEVLLEFSSNDCSSLEATGGTQFKKSRMHNSVTASAIKPRVLFCEFFHIASGSVPWREEENGDV